MTSGFASFIFDTAAEKSAAFGSIESEAFTVAPAAAFTASARPLP